MRTHTKRETKPKASYLSVHLGAGLCILAALFALCITVAAAKAQAPALDDKALIRQCIELARASVAKGNQPFGALLVKNGKVIMRAENTITTDDNILHHAETNLIAATFRKYGPQALRGATLYTSTEPCPMCCGAIYLAGIKRMVFGLSTKRLSVISGFKDNITSRALFGLAKRKIQVTGPVLEKEAEAVMVDYLKKHPFHGGKRQAKP